MQAPIIATFRKPEWEERIKENAARVAYWAYILRLYETEYANVPLEARPLSFRRWHVISPCVSCGANTGECRKTPQAPRPKPNAPSPTPQAPTPQAQRLKPNAPSPLRKRTHCSSRCWVPGNTCDTCEGQVSAPGTYCVKPHSRCITAHLCIHSGSAHVPPFTCARHRVSPPPLILAWFSLVLLCALVAKMTTDAVFAVRDAICER